MRHGKPLLPKTRWLAPFEMEQWIELYNRSEVATVGIPSESVEAAAAASVIMASSASRALSSVRALGHQAAVVDAIFVEAELPFSLWRFPYFPARVWAVFFRLLWLFGYSRGADSIRSTKIRARAAAQLLIAAARSGPVLLVGHGYMNRLIAQELMRLGWVGLSRHKNGYWSISVYGLS